MPGALSHPPREEPRDGRADGGERLHGGPDGRRDPRYRRVGATVLGDDVAVEVLHGTKFNTILLSIIFTIEMKPFMRFLILALIEI